ncbi:MAG: hypothetical protein ACYS7M_04710 [Planctomycetota bacterium]|jgi:hypothetical protein
MRKASSWIMVACLCAAGCGGQPGAGGGGAGGGGALAIDVPEGDVGRPGAGLGGDFSVLLSSDRTVLIRDDDREGSATITAVASAEATFEWTLQQPETAPENLLLPSEQIDNLRLDSEERVTGSESRITLTTAGDAGPQGQEVTVTVAATEVGTDAEATSSLRLRVVRPESALSMTASGESTRVRPGQSIALIAQIRGGEPFIPEGEVEACSGTGTDSPPDEQPSYAVTWQVSDSAVSIREGIPDESTFTVGCLVEKDDATESGATYLAPRGKGTVVFTVEAQDSSGGRVTSTIPVVIAPDAELAVAQAFPDATSVAPGSSVNLTALASGGEAPHTITFDTSGNIQGADLARVSGGSTLTRAPSDGCSNLANGEPCVVRYTAPSDQEGTELITVSITDNLGDEAGSSVGLIVTAEEGLQVVASASPSQVSPNVPVPVGIVITATGGTPPYCVDLEQSGVEPGGPGGSVFFPTPCFESSTEGVYTPPGNAVGTESIKVVVSDNTGQQRTTFVNINVVEEQALNVNLTSASSTINQEACTVLTASALGGVAPYTYKFTIDPAADAGCLFDPAGSPACDDADACVPGTGAQAFDAPDTDPTAQVGYRGPLANTTNTVRVEVTDAVGEGVVDAQVIFVGSQGQLSVATAASPTTVLVGDPVPPAPPFPVALDSEIIGTPDVVGWTHQSAPVPGTFADDSAEDTTWYPGDVPGTYTLRIDVSNATPLNHFDTVNIAVVDAESITTAPNVTGVSGNPEVSVGQGITLSQPVTAGASALDFEWSFDSTPGTVPDFVPNSTSQLASFVPNAVGDYDLRCRVTDLTGRFVDRTLTITANTALNATPSVEMNAIDGATCIVALPGVGEGTLDANHLTAKLNPNPAGGVPDYTLFSWDADFGLPPFNVDPLTGVAEWDVPGGVFDTLQIGFTVNFADATANSTEDDVLVQLAPPVRVTGIFPDPLEGTASQPLQITIFRDLTTGTGAVLFELTQTAGPVACTVPPQAVFGDPGVAEITCGVADSYEFTVDFTDDCSDAVVSVPFTVEMNP